MNTLPSDVEPITYLECSRCGRLQPEKKFNRHPASDTGRVSVCRDCIHKAALDDDPDAVARRKARREYRKKRIEQEREMGRKWRAKYLPGTD